MPLEIRRTILSYVQVVTWMVICRLFFQLEAAEVMDSLRKFTF